MFVYIVYMFWNKWQYEEKVGAFSTEQKAIAACQHLLVDKVFNPEDEDYDYRVYYTKIPFDPDIEEWDTESPF